jgi:hypothetical protein
LHPGGLRLKYWFWFGLAWDYYGGRFLLAEHGVLCAFHGGFVAVKCEGLPAAFAARQPLFRPLLNCTELELTDGILLRINKLAGLGA